MITYLQMVIYLFGRIIYFGRDKNRLIKLVLYFVCGNRGELLGMDTVNTIDEQISDFILEMYQLAQQLPIDAFKSNVFDLFKGIIGFDSAMWGTRSDLLKKIIQQEVFLFNQPEQMMTNYAKVFPVMEAEPLTKLHIQKPGVTHSFSDVYSETQYHASKVYLEHCRLYNIEHALSTMIPVNQQLYHFISIYREDCNDHFTETDRQIKNFLMPHWAEAFRLNILNSFIRQTESLKVSAICDFHGQFVEVEQGFFNRVAEIKPDWFSNKVDLELKTLCYPYEIVLADDLLLYLDSVDGLIIMQIPLDEDILQGLTKKERDVCEELKKGYPNKMIARNLAISDSTVNNHLTAIFRKLKINSRVALTALINKSRH